MSDQEKNKLNNSKIEIFCGPMFSGKTDSLLRSLDRFYWAKKEFLVFKLAKDKRYAEEKVQSHSKNAIKAINVETPLDIWTYCQKHPHIKIVAIDEIQFLPTHDNDTLKPLPFDVVALCKKLKMEGYHVLASGLDMDYKGDPYGIMPQLLAIADNVYKLKAVCFKCGEDAGFSTKLTDSESIEDIGGADMYEARCYTHWLEHILEMKKKRNQK